MQRQTKRSSKGIIHLLLLIFILLTSWDQSKGATLTIPSGTTQTMGSYTVMSGDTLLIYGTLNILNGIMINGVLINKGKLNVSGSLRNNSTGRMFNSDSILVKTDYVDNNAGKNKVLGGIVILTGSSAGSQSISGSNGPMTFAKLQVLGNPKKLNGNIFIQDNLDLQTVIDATASGDTVLVDSAGTIINYSSSSYIQGALYRRARHGIGMDPNPMIFPIGSASGATYRPVILSSIPLAASNKWIVKIQTVGSLITGALISLPNVLMTQRYWQADLLSTGGPMPGGAIVTLGYASTDLLGSPPASSMIIAEKQSTLLGTFTPLGSSGYTSGAISTVTSSSKGTFVTGKSTYLVLGSTSCTNVIVNATLNISPNDTVCAKTPVTFSINASGSYDSVVYYKNSVRILKGPMGTVYTIPSPIDGDWIDAVVSASGCSTPMKRIVLKVNPPFIINIGSDTTVCPGYSKKLTPGITGPANYLWNTGASASSLSISVSSNSSYYVQVIKGGCIASDTINYKVIPPIASPPVLNVTNITGNSMMFSWNALPNANNYEISIDNGNTWMTPNGAGGLSHTVSGLGANTTVTALARAKNQCSQQLSRSISGTTTSGCSITYTSSGDTALCEVPGSVTLQLSNINIPTYKITYEITPPTRNTTYTKNGLSPVAGSPYILRFGVYDSTNVTGCYRIDSILVYKASPNASWNNLASSYCIIAPPVPLTPLNPGGVFSGPGVSFVDNLNQWYFYPSLAPPGNVSITYTICGVSVTKTTFIQNAPCSASIVPGGPTGTTLIKQPQGITTDCDGTIYFSDTENNAIWKVDPFGSASVFLGDTTGAGTSALGAGDVNGFVSTPSSIKLKSPTGLVVVNGDVYFCDTKNFKIKKYDKISNSVITLAGVGTLGDVIGAAGTARFSSPVGIAIDPTLTFLYIADKDNFKVKKIDLTASNFVSVAAGTGLNGYTLGNVDAISTARFKHIAHLAVDANYLYIADPENNAIRKLDFSTNLVSTLVGGPTMGGYVDGLPARVGQPTGISVDCSGNVYFSDYTNCAIRKADPNGFVTTLGGTYPIPTCDSANFNGPSAISVFVKGFIDVADTDNNAIKRFAIQNWRQGAWAGLNTQHCFNDQTDTLKPVTCSGFYTGAGVSQVGGKWIFKAPSPGTFDITYHFKNGFCDDTLINRVIVHPLPIPDLGPASIFVCQGDYSKDSLDAGLNGNKPYATYQWLAGSSPATLTVVGGANKRYFKLPLPMPAPGQSIYVAVAVTDSNGCAGVDTIQITIKATSSLTITGNNSICYGSSTYLSSKGFSSYLWNTGSTSDSLFVSGSGDYSLTATSANGCISNSTFRVTENYAPTICMSATSMSGTNLGYGQYSRSTLAGTGIAGGANGNGKVATFSGLWDSYLDKSGKYLYITEELNQNDVRRIRLSDTTVMQFTGASAGAYTNGTLANSKFNHPYGIIENTLGQFIIADKKNQSIRIIDTLGNTVKTFAGYRGSTSPFGPSWKDGKDTTARFGDPFDITQDYFGNIYVTDFATNLIRKITPQGIVTTIAGDTLGGYGTLNGTSYKATFDNPLGIDWDVSGNLWVTDRNGTTLRKITPDTVVTSVASGFSKPWNIVTDKYGNIYVSDFGNNAIKKVDKNGTVTTIASGVNQPRGITIDPITERLYVSEYGANRINSLIKNKAVVICNGDSVKIDATCSSASSYSWSPSTGLQITGQGKAIAFPSKTTTYHLTITANGCTNTDSITVVVNPKPLPNAGPDKSICKGDSVQIGAAPVTGLAYVWTPAIAPAKDTLANPFVKPLLNSTYFISVTNKSTGCQNKDTVDVIVNSLPVANAGSDKSVCYGDSVAIGPLVGNTATYNYSWSPKAGLNDSTHINPNASPSSSRSYHLQVINKVTLCSNTDTMLVTVNPQPLASFTTSNLCQMDTTKFTNTSSVTAPATSINSYNWDFGDISSGTRNTSTLKNPVHLFSGTASYSVKFIITDNLGCRDTSTVQVTPLPKPNAGFTYTIPCSSGAIAFDDTTSNIASRAWSFGDPSSGSNNTSTVDPTSHTFVGTSPYTVILIVTGNNSCKDTTTQIINPKYLQVDAGNDTLVCFGALATLRAKVTGGGNTIINYSWTGPGTSTINTPGQPNTNVSDAPLILPYKYFIQVTQSGCIAKDSVNVTITPLPAVDAGLASIGVCQGKSVTLGGSPTANSGTSIVWSPNVWINGNSNTIANPIATPLRDTSYVVTITDANQCVNSDTIKVIVNPLPNPAIAQSRAIGCQGTPMVLSINTSNRPYHIVWSNTTAGNATIGIDTIKASANAAGTYKVVITNTVSGCADSSSRTVDFIQPLSALSIKAPDSNCINQPVPLIAQATGDSIKYHWTSIGTGIFADTLNDSTLYYPNVQDPSPILFTIEAYNSCDTLTATKSIRMDTIPVGSFTYSPPQSFASDPVSFINTSDTTLYRITDWLWNFKDGSSSNQFHTSHIFSTPGTYDVDLIVTNKAGCKNNYTLPVEIFDIHVLFVPSVFSPFASNNENRTVKVYGAKISSTNFNFKIFNRWGDLLWETSDLNEASTVGWDGTNKNKEPQSMGVFTYVLKAQYIDGKAIDQTGTVTLIK